MDEQLVVSQQRKWIVIGVGRDESEIERLGQG